MKIGQRLSLLVWAACVFVPTLAFGGAPADISARAVADNIAYNAGRNVRFRIIFSGTLPSGAISISARIRYLGEARLAAPERVVARELSVASGTNSTSLQSLWAIPRDARTGCYEADLVGRDSKSGATVFDLSPAFTFTVYRKLINIRSVDLDRTFYTSGDPVRTRVALENLSGIPISGLRVEFSERYWPWIAQTSERAGVDVLTLAQGVTLAAHGTRSLTSDRAASAPQVKAPTAYQFAVVVWDRERKNIYAIAFSPLAFVHPPGVRLAEPYAGAPGAALQYLHPNLESLDFARYRQFYPSSLDRAAIEFDTAHTLFASGAEAEVRFRVRDPGPAAWPKVAINLHWLGPDKREISGQVLAPSADLEAGGPPLEEDAKLTLPAGESGIFLVRVEVADASGDVLAANTLELAANPLPKSILIFCAHQDDEGAHYGMIRAAVENHIPIHFVYFTGGDAGSCDRYYQHSCSPDECLNFGELRMEEARASLAHLGVAKEDIYFLGLPDGGSGQIWFDHREAARPYMSVMLSTDHSPYREAARPNLPFARDSVVEAAKEFIQRFRPEVIYTGHPDERHVDHRTNNWFVMRALEELSAEGELSPEPTVLVDQSYGPGPQKHAPYDYEKETFYVSGEAAALGQEAGWFYQSQGGNSAEGNRRDYGQLRRGEVHWRILEWKRYPRWNEEP
jgi:LmbE family N-acetylglucosaminyl deacetylase